MCNVCSTSVGSFSDATQANLHTNGLRKPTQAALLLCYLGVQGVVLQRAVLVYATVLREQ